MYIYLPGKSGCNPAHLDSAGLGDLTGADSGPLMADISNGGPDGGSGVLCVWDDPTRPGSVFPGLRPSQEWTSIEGGKYWLGREKGEPITPASLARRKQLAGQDVLLEDGQAWHVPVARQLPQCFGLEGMTVKPAYKPFWDAAYAVAEKWLTMEEAGPTWAVPWDDGFDFVAQALGMNYRVNAAVLRWLGIVGTDQLGEIVETATEGLAAAALLCALQKKSGPPASGGEPTAAGEPG